MATRKISKTRNAADVAWHSHPNRGSTAFERVLVCGLILGSVGFAIPAFAQDAATDAAKDEAVAMAKDKAMDVAKDKAADAVGGAATDAVKGQAMDMAKDKAMDTVRDKAGDVAKDALEKKPD
jgi:hypothetical protein